MGYSFEDLYKAEIEPKLRELLAQEEPAKMPEEYIEGKDDKFIRIITNALDKHEKLKGYFIRAVFPEIYCPEDFVQKCFEYYNDESELTSLQYRINNRKVKVKYDEYDDE